MLMECCPSLTRAYSGRPCVLQLGATTGPLIDSTSPLQVCISLIKRCLCASCLPSAHFIIKVSERGKNVFGRKSDQPSRFTNLWSCFHEWGGAPCCSSCRTPARLFAKGAHAVCPCWLTARRPIPACILSLPIGNPCNFLSYPNFRLPSPTSWMFLHRGKNKPPYSNARCSNLQQLERDSGL